MGSERTLPSSRVTVRVLSSTFTSTVLDTSISVLKELIPKPFVAGLYHLLSDETCWFLAVDFDKEQWRQDVSAFLATCKEEEIPAYWERARSGNGGHVWIFFSTSIERAIGSFSREALDHFLIFSEKQARKIVSEYVDYFYQMRPHQGVGQIPDRKVELGVGRFQTPICSQVSVFVIIIIFIDRWVVSV